MEKISTEDIPESMLRTIYAMANESRREKPYLYDKKAVELAQRLEPSLLEGAAEIKSSFMGKGALARAMLLDRMVVRYVRKHPDARVINLACGMDTRFCRVDNGRIRWYDLDLPDIIEARKRLLQEEERVSMIGKSALDDTWAEEVEGEGPVLILAERLTMYLDRQKLQNIFRIIRSRFREAEIFMEIASPYTVKNTYENVDGNSRPKYTWGAKSGKELASITTGFKAVRDFSLMEGLEKMNPSYYLLKLFPPLRRLSNKIAVLRREDG